MEDQKKPTAAISAEQLDALAQSLLPVMQEFFGSERGKKIWKEHLRGVERGNDNAA